MYVNFLNRIKLQNFIFILLLSIITKVQADWIQTKQTAKPPGYNPFPKKIWVYWSSQKSMDVMDAVFFKQLNTFVQKSQNKGWQFTFLNDQNLHQYLSNMAQFQKSIIKDGQTIPANKADMLRLFIIEQHGGIYVDITSLFIENLSWLQLENLISNPQVVNKHPIQSPQPQVLLFYWDKHQFRNHYIDQHNNLRNNFPGFESWFIAAKPNATLIRQWRIKFVDYYAASTQRIFEELRQHDIYIGDFKFENYHCVYYSLYFIFNRKQKQLDRQTGLNRINVNFYYKLWAIQCKNGPCTTYYFSNFAENYFQLDFFVKTEQQLAKSLNIEKIRYFVKFTRYHIQQTVYALSVIVRPQDHWKSLKQLYEENKKRLQSCLDLIYMNTESFIFKHVFEGIAFGSAAKYVSPQVSQQYKQYCYQLAQSQKATLFNRTINFIQYFVQYQQSGFYGMGLGFIIIGWLGTVAVKNYWKQKKIKRKVLKRPCQEDKDIISIVVSKIDHFWKTLFSFRISYILLTLTYSSIAVYFTYRFQTNYEKQQYAIIIWTIIGCLSLKKFTQIHHQLKSKQSESNEIFGEILNFCLTKLCMDLIFNHSHFSYVGMVYVAGFSLKCINIFEHSSVLFQNANLSCVCKKAKCYNKNILITICVLILLIPNLKYYMIGSQYLLLKLFHWTIIYAWILAGLIVTFETYYYFCKNNNAFGFRGSKNILIRYLAVILIDVYVEGFWGKLFVEKFKFLFLLAIFLIFAANSQAYSKKKKLQIPTFFLVSLISLLTFVIFCQKVMNDANIVNYIWGGMQYTLLFVLIMTGTLKIIFRIVLEQKKHQ